MSGSGIQQERLTPLARATSGESWRSDPAGAAWSALLCAATMPACLGYELTVEAERARDEARRQVAELQAAAGDVATGVAAGAADVLVASAAPLEQASSIAMWGAIALFAVLGIILLLIIWWTFLR